jgi:Fur family ferric uptake transcriptional regulator
VTQDLLSEFRTYLGSRGLRIGRARMAIAEVILGAKRHLTPTEIFQEVRRGHPGTGLVSVYRTIALLKEASLITESKFSGKGEVYVEPMRGRPHHDHLFCIRCGEVVEFQNEQIERLQNQVARERGYEITNHSLMIWGICAPCRKAGEPPVSRRKEDKLKLRIF